MREKRTAQRSIFESDYVDHAIGRELAAVSDWLDQHPEVLTLIERDVAPRGCAELGRAGLSLESVLRCAFLKQYRQVGYRELAFLLLDSRSFQRFARIDPLRVPKHSTLHGLISRISAASWEAVNLALVRSAREEKIEGAQTVRIDATVTESPILEPSDSQLLRDGVRVMVRLLTRARQLLGHDTVAFRSHHRAAKRRHTQIMNARKGTARTRLYRDLVKLVQATVGYLDTAQQAMRRAPLIEAQSWCPEAAHYRHLVMQVIDQTERRVFDGEQVPATEKIVSLFEPHTDIIVKDRRETHYGHKVTFSSGRSGLVLDAVVERGNPADSERFVPMLDRHIERYGRAPQHLAADGGYAAKANLDAAQERGDEATAFHKKRGIKVEAMTPKRWLYNKLRRFRAGIEAGVSYLKRCFGLDRCNWQGLAHFNAYVWSAIVAHNLVVLGRLRSGAG